MRILERIARESARDYALRTLKYNIINLELAPGSMMSEQEISQAINLSRTPVREALMELSKSKIVEIMPQRGSCVALIDYDLVEESQFLRLVLERAIIKLACERADELDFSRIDENLKLQIFCMENGLDDRIIELDNEYHKAYFTMCNKAQTYQLMNSMTAHFDRVRVLSVRGGTVKENKTTDDLIAIARAVREKDVAQALALVDTHLSRYKIDAMDLKHKFPEYFKTDDNPVQNLYSTG